jgi:hypothetical protein
MIDFESECFQKIKFSLPQIEQFVRSAGRDIEIASQSDIPEVIFKFSYDALIKIGITLIAGEGYKVRSKTGHHIKILEKLGQILDNEDVKIMGNKMRQERNVDLYSGGSSISEKDSRAYLDFVKDIFAKASLTRRKHHRLG